MEPKTPPDPTSNKSLKKAVAKAKVKAPKTKKGGSANVATGAFFTSGTLIQGGVLGNVATGAHGMCERPQSVEAILSQLTAILGCVEYTSFLDSFVENGTYDNISVDRGDKNPLCKIAGPQDLFNWKCDACIRDASSPAPDLCPNIGLNGPCCFVGLNLRVEGAC